MPVPNVERRIARVARQTARIVLELRAEGHHDAARALEAAAIEVCEQMRVRRRGLVAMFKTGQIAPAVRP